MYLCHPGTMQPGRVLAEGDTFSDLTFAHHGSSHGRIRPVHRVGGGRHHIMYVDSGKPDYLRKNENPILVLLPGDTNYPEDREARE